MAKKQDSLPVQKASSADLKSKDSSENFKLKKRLLKLKPTKRNLARGERIALRHAKKFVTGRWDNLQMVRTEIFGWLVVVGLLVVLAFVQAGIYNRSTLTSKPADGGTYAEGVIGKIETISPLYVGTDRERAASKLVFASLLDYDDTGNLRPELAQSYSVSEDGKTYTVNLRDNVRWSDGAIFGADDVILTLNLIKNPAVDSVLYSSWKTVEIKKIDDKTVSFSLQNPFVSFSFALTFGILPHHILKNVAPTNIRSFLAENADEVVGTGAFVYRSSESLAGDNGVLHFAANEKYFRGEPRLKAFSIHTYASSQDLLAGFQNKEINAAAGLGVKQAAESLNIAGANLLQNPTADGVFVLFNNTAALTGDKNVREALRFATDRNALRTAAISIDNQDQKPKLDIPKGLETPILPSSVEGLEKLKQPGYDAAAAAKKLDEAGWQLNADKQREKGGELLQLSMLTIKNTDYERVAGALAEQWRGLGVAVDLTVADQSSVQQNYFITRNYDVLVYQIHLGADPDVLAYWGSSQANARGLNLANYKSTLSDLALTNARSQMDKTKRNARYTDFVQRWMNDVPAIALYRPNFYYLKSEKAQSIDGDYKIIDTAARFGNVRNWTVETQKLRNTP